jgi:GT2 family glycosyltransferase
MLSIVIPHWPLDEEANDALRRSVASFPPECERVVVVNDGTGYGRNVNVGLRLATGDYIAVVNNDCRLADGDIYDRCVPETVTSPLIIGERQGLGESIEPEGFHGCFWVVPRPVLERVGLLDERFEWGYWEDDDYIARLHEAGIPTRQVPSVRVKHIGGLTTVQSPRAPRLARAQRAAVQGEMGMGAAADRSLSPGPRQRYLALLPELLAQAGQRLRGGTSPSAARRRV